MESTIRAAKKPSPMGKVPPQGADEIAPRRAPRRCREVVRAAFKPLSGLVLMALLLARPQAAAVGALRAMAAWASSVAPAVFPFLALMPLLTCEEAARAYEMLLGGVTSRLLKLPGAAAAAMVVGASAGVPAGALAARGVAARSGMNRGQLQRLALSVMGFSPAFLISGVGAGMLGSAALGWRLALSQILSQLTMALLLKSAWRNRTRPVEDAGPLRQDGAIRGAVLAALTICGYMALFGALARAAGSLAGDQIGGALLCLLDVPSGARLLADLPLPLEARLMLISALCGFGGLCLIAQCLGALRGCGPGWAECVALRVLAAMLCAGYTLLGLRLGAPDLSGVAVRLCANPLAAGGLCASLLALPVLFKMGKSIS